MFKAILEEHQPLSFIILNFYGAFLTMSLSSYYILNIYPFYFEEGGGLQRHYDNYCGSSLSTCALLLGTNYFDSPPNQSFFFPILLSLKKKTFGRKNCLT
jgi:hypothetical protein